MTQLPVCLNARAGVGEDRSTMGALCDVRGELSNRNRYTKSFYFTRKPTGLMGAHVRAAEASDQRLPSADREQSSGETHIHHGTVCLNLEIVVLLG